MKRTSQNISHYKRIGLVALAFATILLASCPLPTPDPEPTAPAAPENLRFTAGETTVTLRWDEVSDATSYRVYRNGSDTPIETDDPITETNYTDTGLEISTNYTYTVRAVKGNLESTNSNEVTATTDSPPPAPDGFTATEADGVVTLSWTAVDGASSYNIYRNNMPLVTDPPVITGTTTTYTDRTVVRGTAYSYTVRALNGNLESLPSDVATANPPLLPPGNLMATPGDAQVELSWDMVVGAATYRIYRNGDTEPLETNPPIITGTTTTYTDSTAENDTDYSYTVRAVGNNGVESPPGTADTATPAATPAAPGNLTATAVADRTITLIWDEVDDADSYRIYRDGSDMPIETTPATIVETTYTDTGLINDTAYSYTVRAVNTNGVEGPHSTADTATPKIIDFENLGNAGNVDSWGMWSDGTTMWVSDDDANKLFAYNLMTEARDPAKDFDTLIAAGNTSPYGIWGNADTMWVRDGPAGKVFAYNMETREREPTKDFTGITHAALDITSNGTTMWMADNTTRNRIIRAYNLMTRELDPAKNISFAAGNDGPIGVWVAGTTMWVTNGAFGNVAADKLYAYDTNTRLPLPAQDFDSLNVAGNNNPRAIWSNADTMWVLDGTNRIYAYDLTTMELE